MKKIISFVFGMCVCLSCYAGVDKTLVSSAEKYLNSITGLTGNFIQYANKKSDTGTFSMLRPGRIRLDYDTTPIQLISNGTDLYFFDKSLDQITTVPLTSTPAGILVRKKIDLTNADIVVTDTTENKTTFSLKMNIRDKAGLGNMLVTFNRKPVKLNSWIVTDATGNKTEIKFSDLENKTNFDKDYFQLSRHKTTGTNHGDDFYD